MLAVARLRRGLTSALLPMHALAAGGPAAVRGRLAAGAVTAFAAILAMLLVLAVSLMLALVLAVILVLQVLLVLLVLGGGRRLGGSRGRDRKRERGNDDLHFEISWRKTGVVLLRKVAEAADPIPARCRRRPA
jgi:hypothetical protein